MKQKYNYEGTIDLLKRVADTTHVITRTELVQCLSNGEFEIDKSSLATALKKLRVSQLDKLGIVLECPHGNRRKGQFVDYNVYYKKTEKVTVAKEDGTVTALKKDNERLYAQLEELKAEYYALQEELEAYAEREKKHLILIEAYHSLALEM